MRNSARIWRPSFCFLSSNKSKLWQITRTKLHDTGLQHMSLSHISPSFNTHPFHLTSHKLPTFLTFPPTLEISSPCHRKCPSTTQSLVPLLPYRYHWVASTRRHHQSHPVPDSPSGAVARKLGTKPIGLCFFNPEVTPPKNKAWHNKKLPNAFF